MPPNRASLSRRAVLRLAGLGAAAAVRPRPARAAGEQRLVIGMASEPTHLDPMRSNDSASQYAYNLIYDRLVTLDEKLQPAPAAAESWQVSADGTVYTFRLRKGLRFHDGTPLTADDVKFSFDRILDPKNASDKRSFISVVQQVEVVDPHTVRMRLEAPYAPFLPGRPSRGVRSAAGRSASSSGKSTTGWSSAGTTATGSRGPTWTR